MQRTRLLPLAGSHPVRPRECSDRAGRPVHARATTSPSDLSGWSGYVEPGYLLCGHGATAGCPDVSTNRIMARAGSAQAIWSQGRWEWTAPPGTTIVGGSLAYRTRMRHSQFFARVKMRADGVTWDAAPTLVSEQQTTALTDHVIAAGRRLPPDRRRALRASRRPPGSVTGAWDDYVTLVRLVVTVDDASPPALAWVDGGGLLDGAWHRGDVCATLGIGDGAVGRRLRLARERRRLGGLDGGADRLAVPAGSPLRAARPLPGRRRARRRHPRRRRRRRRRERRPGGGAAVHRARSTARLPARAWSRRSPSAADARPAVELDVGDATSGVDRRRGARSTARRCRSRSRAAVRAAGPPPRWPTARTRWRGRSPTPPATAARAARASTCPTPRRRCSARRSRRTAPSLGAGRRPQRRRARSATTARASIRPRRALTARRRPIEHVWQARRRRARRRGRAPRGRRAPPRPEDRRPRGQRRPPGLGRDRRGAERPRRRQRAGGRRAPSRAARPAPHRAAGAGARKRAVAAVRAVAARVGAARPRVVIVHLRAHPRLRFVLRLRCGATVRTLRVRASARGIAIVRVACAGVATVRMAAPPARLLVRIAARRLPLRLRVRPRAAVGADRRAGQRPPGRAARPRASCSRRSRRAGWRRVGRVRADASGPLRDLVRDRARRPVRRCAPGCPPLAGAASAPFVLTMR